MLNSACNRRAARTTKKRRVWISLTIWRAARAIRPPHWRTALGTQRRTVESARLVAFVAVGSLLPRGRAFGPTDAAVISSSVGDESPAGVPVASGDAAGSRVTAYSSKGSAPSGKRLSRASITIDRYPNRATAAACLKVRLSVWIFIGVRLTMVFGLARRHTMPPQLESRSTEHSGHDAIALRVETDPGGVLRRSVDRTPREGIRLLRQAALTVTPRQNAPDLTQRGRTPGCGPPRIPAARRPAPDTRGGPASPGPRARTPGSRPPGTRDPRSIPGGGRALGNRSPCRCPAPTGTTGGHRGGERAPRTGCRWAWRGRPPATPRRAAPPSPKPPARSARTARDSAGLVPGVRPSTT